MGRIKARLVAFLPVLARTPLGERALWSLARSDPQVIIEALGPRRNRSPRLGAASDWPASVDRFEDLAFLFASTQLNHGIVSLAIDEAAYLFRLARSLGPATLAEIGRYKGGSALLLAAAMHPRSRLWSYDLHVKLATIDAGAEIDGELADALARYGLRERVEIVVADSKTVDPPSGGCDLVFVDGDHTYAGVRADYENWRAAVKPGGHLLFHDAAKFRPFAVANPDVMRLMDEIRHENAREFPEAGGVGALVHFVRRDPPKTSWSLRPR